MTWHEKQVASSVAVGIIIMAIGCLSFAVGQVIGADETKVKAKKIYWLINLWLLVFIPLSLVYNMLDGFFGGYIGLIAPYPLLGNSFITYGLCWLTLRNLCCGKSILDKEKLSVRLIEC